MDVAALDQDMQWLTQTEPLPLHPSWRKPIQRSWLAKVIGAQRPLPKIGHLSMHFDVLRLAIGYQTPVEVQLEEPFTLFLSRWRPTETAPIEINLSLRARSARPGTEWLQLRTVWLSDHVDESVPQKQNFSPYISPALFKRVFRALAGYAQIHNSRFPEGLDLDVDDDVLIELKSEGGLNSCAACGSLDVLPIAPETYRCGTCGYEGGEGLPRVMRERRQKAFDAMEPLERLDSAYLDLRKGLDDVKGVRSAFDDDMLRLKCALNVRQSLRDAAYKVPRLDDAMRPYFEGIGDDGHSKASWAALEQSLRPWIDAIRVQILEEGGRFRDDDASEGDALGSVDTGYKRGVLTKLAV